ARALADRAAQRKSVLARHHDVQDNEIDARGAHRAASGGGAVRGRGAVARFLQIADQGLADIARVIDDQDMRLGAAFWHRFTPRRTVQHGYWLGPRKGAPVAKYVIPAT